MKTSEIKNLSIQEISEKLEHKSDEYNRMKFDHKVSPLQNPMQLRNSRKIIARMFTIFRRKLDK